MEPVGYDTVDNTWSADFFPLIFKSRNFTSKVSYSLDPGHKSGLTWVQTVCLQRLLTVDTSRHRVNSK